MTHTRPHLWHAILLLLLLPGTLTAQTTDNASKSNAPVVPPGTNLSDPQVLLSVATAANSLDDAKLTPWHLKASYESFDEKGALDDQGTFEEWRLSPDSWKRTYTSSHYNQTEYGWPTGTTYQTDSGAPPWPVSLMGKELSHPMPDQAEVEDTNPELSLVSEKTVKLSCLTLSQPLKRSKWPLGVLPTYCFNANSPMLRIEIFDGNIQASRNEMAVFRQTYLAKDIRLSDAGRPLLHIHLLSVAGMSSEEVAAIAMPAPPATPAPTVVTLTSGVVQGSRLGGAMPQYPTEARIDRVRGTVVLKVTIGTDGRVHNLKVVSSPGDLLSISAVAAVESWVYRPYLLKGKPVKVQTTINVKYELGI